VLLFKQIHFVCDDFKPYFGINSNVNGSGGGAGDCDIVVDVDIILV